MFEIALILVSLHYTGDDKIRYINEEFAIGSNTISKENKLKNI